MNPVDLCGAISAGSVVAANTSSRDPIHSDASVICGALVREISAALTWSEKLQAALALVSVRQMERDMAAERAMIQAGQALKQEQAAGFEAGAAGAANKKMQWGRQ